MILSYLFDGKDPRGFVCFSKETPSGSTPDSMHLSIAVLSSAAGDLFGSKILHAAGHAGFEKTR